MKNTITVKYFDPRVCFHLFLRVNEHAAEQLTVSCSRCGLEGAPSRIGRLNFWARSQAYSNFYKIAVKVDSSVSFLVLFCALCFSCSAHPAYLAIDDDLSEVDAGADTDTDEQLDTDTDTETDEQLDTETDLEEDSDTDLSCPWRCRQFVGWDTCSPDQIENPTAVHNRNFFCPEGEICCQPWPTDDDQGLRDHCSDFDMVCAASCSTPDNTKACFDARGYCCRKDPDD